MFGREGRAAAKFRGRGSATRPGRVKCNAAMQQCSKAAILDPYLLIIFDYGGALSANRYKALAKSCQALALITS